MNWSDKYIGIPFVDGGRAESGCDWGGLALLVLKNEKGIIAPDFNEYARTTERQVLSAGIKGILAREFVPVPRPEPFDVLVFSICGFECHVGICAGGGDFLHTEKHEKFSRITDMSDPVWSRRLTEVRRHKTLVGGS